MNLIGLKFFTLLGFFYTQAVDFEFNAKRDVRFFLRELDTSLDDCDDFGLSGLESLMESSFDKTKPTTFLIHGYQEGTDIEHYETLSK